MKNDTFDEFHNNGLREMFTDFRLQVNSLHAILTDWDVFMYIYVW